MRGQVAGQARTRRWVKLVLKFIKRIYKVDSARFAVLRHVMLGTVQMLAYSNLHGDEEKCETARTFWSMFMQTVVYRL